MTTSTTIIIACTMSMKKMLESHYARVNVCSLKKKIGEPAGTNISTMVCLGLLRLLYSFMPHIVIFLHDFFTAL